MTGWFELGSALAPLLGILLACLIIAPPDFRSREERRRDREAKYGRRPTPEQVAGGDKRTSGRMR